MGVRKYFSVTDQPLQAAEEKTLLAAQGDDTVIHVTHVYFSVILAATGAAGRFAVEDGSGGDRFVEEDADTDGERGDIHFGEEHGFALTPNTALIATVDNAGTNEATVRVTVTGFITGNIGGL